MFDITQKDRPTLSPSSQSGRRCLSARFTSGRNGWSPPRQMWIKGIHPEMRHQVLGKVAVVQHAPEFKQAAVIALCTRQGSAQAIAQKLAVSRPTLYNLKNQLLGRETASTMKCQNNSSPDSEQTELQRQVDRLRRDIRQPQLEHDLLKWSMNVSTRRTHLDRCFALSGDSWRRPAMRQQFRTGR